MQNVIVSTMSTGHAYHSLHHPTTSRTTHVPLPHNLVQRPRIERRIQHVTATSARHVFTISTVALAHRHATPDHPHCGIVYWRCLSTIRNWDDASLAPMDEVIRPARVTLVIIQRQKRPKRNQKPQRKRIFPWMRMIARNMRRGGKRDRERDSEEKRTRKK